MINICQVIKDCKRCPYQFECGPGLPTWDTKENWLNDLNKMLRDVQDAIKGVEEKDDE